MEYSNVNSWNIPICIMEQPTLFESLGKYC